MEERITFKNAVEAWLAAPSRKLGRRKFGYGAPTQYFIQAWGDIDIHEIDYLLVDKLFNELKTKKSKLGKPYSSNTYNFFVGVYRAIMNFARDDMRCKIYPPKVRMMRGSARNQFLEEDELTKLKSHLDPLRADLLTYSHLTGARASACSDLRFDQISEDGNYIVYHEESTKNGLPWMVPVIGKIKELIEKRCKMRDELEERCPYLKGKITHVFFQISGHIARNGKKITASSICNRRWKKAVAEAGFEKEGICFHVAGRHSFATNAKRKGVDDRLIMAAGNWKNRASMDRYSHIVGPDLIEAQKQMQGLS